MKVTTELWTPNTAETRDMDGQYILFSEVTPDQEKFMRKMSETFHLSNDRIDMKMIYKWRGSAGVIDPLDQMGSFGWKVTYRDPGSWRYLR